MCQQKEKATKLLKEIGEKGKGRIVTLFDNSQNVHSQEIDASALDILNFLIEYEKNYSSKQDTQKSYDDVCNEILEMCGESSKQLVETTLDRVRLDTVLYNNSFSLQNVIKKVWLYIQNNQNKEELQKRLLEELKDAVGTCSSGYLTRLVNCITGYDEHLSLRISWKDQIFGNIKGRLNAKVRQMDNLTFQAKILEEMSEDIRDKRGNFKDRRCLLRFFRRHIGDIREEMLGEFKEYIDEAIFEQHFREGIKAYESPDR